MVRNLFEILTTAPGTGCRAWGGDRGQSGSVGDGAGAAVAGVVVLVVFLGFVELGGLHDLGGDGAIAPFAFSLLVFDEGFGEFELFFFGGEDH